MVSEPGEQIINRHFPLCQQCATDSVPTGTNGHDRTRYVLSPTSV